MHPTRWMCCQCEWIVRMSADESETEACAQQKPAGSITVQGRVTIDGFAGIAEPAHLRVSPC